jgi:hypothetical protein
LDHARRGFIDEERLREELRRNPHGSQISESEIGSALHAGRTRNREKALRDVRDGYILGDIAGDRRLQDVPPDELRRAIDQGTDARAKRRLESLGLGNEAENEVRADPDVVDSIRRNPERARELEEKVLDGQASRELRTLEKGNFQSHPGGDPYADLLRGSPAMRRAIERGLLTEEQVRGAIERGERIKLESGV